MNQSATFVCTRSWTLIFPPSVLCMCTWIDWKLLCIRSTMHTMYICMYTFSSVWNLLTVGIIFTNTCIIENVQDFLVNLILFLCPVSPPSSPAGAGIDPGEDDIDVLKRVSHIELDEETMRGKPCFMGHSMLSMNKWAHSNYFWYFPIIFHDSVV